ncbi:MAG TPA: hypothetical protein VG873_12425 [Burkholderiales bacterium]|nr:hypothetical protein [Burkholderiales bacterium]
MKEQLLRLRADLGRTGLLALVLLLVAFSFHALVVAPLQAKNAGLALTLSQKAPASVARSGEKLARVYEALGREETATDWLAKLYAISKATGVEMPSANYKMESGASKEDASSRIQRYEIVLPVTATYGQLRDFLGRALAEIPVLSLDQLSLKRESRNQGEVQAELRLTLHLVKP